MTTKRKTTIWCEPPAILSNILINERSSRIEAKDVGYHRSKGSSLRMFFDFKLLKKDTDSVASLNAKQRGKHTCTGHCLLSPRFDRIALLVLVSPLRSLR